eukprot:403369949
MGNHCTGKREKMEKAGRYSKHLAVEFKKSMSIKYQDFREDAREKYEARMLNYKLQKSRTGVLQGNDSLIQYVSVTGSGTKYQEILLQFERQFPLNFLDIHEFERRVKKLVFHDEYIYVWQIVESFKTCPGFEDIEVSTSLSLSLLTSDFLKSDQTEGDTPHQQNEQQFPNFNPSQSMGSQRSTEDRSSEQFVQQKIFIPYLILLSILYCKGTPRARATKFYELVQMELTPHVCCLDKELREYFRKILQLCTLFLTEQFTASYIALAAPEEARAETKEYSRDILFTLKPEILEQLTDQIFEDFLDTLFVTQTRPDRDEFIGKLSLEFAQYLVPSFIRGLVLKAYVKHMNIQ